VTSGFRWTTFDLTGRLPEKWQQEIAAVAAAEAEFREFPRTPSLSREAADVRTISRGRLHAGDLRHNLPWLYGLYRDLFLDLAREVVSDEPVTTTRDDRYGVVLNVQCGIEMRFECHVDSNPLTGLLFCTDHPAGGGELVFAHDPMATDIGAVDQDCSVIRPHAGHVIFFDGREYPHYARPLTSGSDIRIAAVMNFYTASCPEAERPPGTQRRLYRHEGARLGRVRPRGRAEAVRRGRGTDGAAA
jgi:hypothetical protein